MVGDTALDATAYEVPKHEGPRPPARSQVSRLADTKFPDRESLKASEAAALAVFGIIYLVIVLLPALSALYACILLAGGAAVMALAYRYLRINNRRMAHLSACMLLARMDREFQMLGDFIHSSLLPIERLMDSGTSTRLAPLPSDKQRYYFMLVQIKSEIEDRRKKIQGCLDDPEMGKLKACFHRVRREVSLHQSVDAQSRTAVPLENIEDFTLALVNDLDPECVGEEFPAQSRG